MQARCVEQRHGQKHGPLGHVLRVRQGLAVAQQLTHRRDAEADDVAADIALGAKRALGAAGGAGRVHDGGVILGVEGNVRHVLLRQLGVIRMGAQHVFEALNRGIGVRQLRGAGGDHGLDAQALGEGRNGEGAFLVHEDDGGA